MKLIAHRRNTIAELAATPRELGVEVDVRSQAGRLVIHHDAFGEGEDFVAWLDHYRHGTLILNVKEEGLENALLRLTAERGIADFFFLDQSFPFLLKTARSGERRCAVRLSEFEHIGTALSLAGMIDWVWVDCFTRFPLTASDAAKLRAAHFRLCLVSPELQGRPPETEIPALRARLAADGIEAEAVCTKRPELWAA
ncbi:MAG TPA: phosphatidylinositol-specific phospholipase C/glycerophosphodiester phosphodiesterase family protein [Burkholderiales bacterium]|nr:phosphatidylinositol-specific phospholipase C/glycerophosphodiester phosphodiesterase family protein [Burkholderiales bacterium]